MKTDDSRRPICAVIILNWNGEKLLPEYLPSVAEGTNQAFGRVIVADNGSTDSSVQLLERDFPGVELLRFTENHGFAEGYNKALRWAMEQGYKYTVLLNSDVRTPAGWLEPLVEYMERHPGCGACQPKLLSDAEPGKFEYAGASGGFIDRNGYPFCRGRIYDDVRPVFWASGAALMVPTALYLEAGGLDAGFFAHMEEIDLCWRIHLKGKEIAVVPQSHVYHLGGGSLPASNPRKTYLNFRNNLLLLHKNLPAADLRATLLRRRLLDTVAWLKFTASFDFANAAAILRAHRDFRRMRRDYTAHPSRNLLREPMQRRNILIDHYLRRIKRFSQLSI